MINNIFLGLGSNLGDRLEMLNRAVHEIEKEQLCRVLKASSVYETLPFGGVDQNNYYNAVIEIESDLDLHQLLRYVKAAELNLGRKKSPVRWSSREIDIDILYYNTLIYKEDLLQVPHIERFSRDFVIVPLVEVCGNFFDPELNKKVCEIDYSGLDNHIIKKLDTKLKYQS